MRARDSYLRATDARCADVSFDVRWDQLQAEGRLESLAEVKTLVGAVAAMMEIESEK